MQKEGWRESNTAVHNAAGGGGDDDEGKRSKMITCLNGLAEWYLVESIPPQIGRAHV